MLLPRPFGFAVATRLISAIAFLFQASLWQSLPAEAQVLPDSTLGTQVVPGTPGGCTGGGGLCSIFNGSTRGSNLFHSFQQFSLPNGDVAAFITNPDIQNVIVRVTGVGSSFVSNINGTIATTDPTITTVIPTNFFLLNPNGIVWGPNAQILVGGSFLASTAERMLFQDGTVFDTRAPDIAPLLTVSVPVGLQMGATPGSIQMQSTLFGAGLNSEFSSLTLVGGEIALDNTILFAPDQRVDLAALASGGNVELRQTGNTLQLASVPDRARANISLANQSQISVAANSGGNVSLYGRDVNLADFSVITTGILSGLGSATSQAGDIVVDATGTVRLAAASQLNNLVAGRGNSGRVSVSGQAIVVADGSIIGSASVGIGNAGEVTLRAKESIVLSGRTINGQSSSVISAVALLPGFSGNGNGGNILLQAPTILLQDNAQIGTSNLFAQGAAGNIRIEASTELNLTGRSGIQAITSGMGQAGMIDLIVGKLEMTDGAGISATTVGQGNAGSVQVSANTVNLDGASYLSSGVDTLATGNGGNVTLTTGSLSLTGGASLSASTFGQGNAGSVQVKANAVALDGTTLDSQFTSGIFSSVGSTATGIGGDVTLTTDTLSLTRGAQISASTFGRGNAGNVLLFANAIAIDGLTPNGVSISSIGSQVEPAATGNGGNVRLSTSTLSITNGAQISASTFGNGNAGNVSISATERILLSDGFIASAVDGRAFGNGGDIQLAVDRLEMRNRSQILASTFGQGNAGNLAVHVRTIKAESGAQIAANTASRGNAGNLTIYASDVVELVGSTEAGVANTGLYTQVTSTGTGKAGNLTVETDLLRLRDGAQINATTFGQNDAGSLTVRASDIALTGTTTDGQFPSALQVRVEPGARGNAGNLTIATNRLTVTDGARVVADTTSQGSAGKLTIKATDSVEVSGVSVIGKPSLLSAAVTSGAVGNGGDLSIETNQLLVQDQAQVIVSNQSFGDAGNLTIAANFIQLNNRGKIIAETASGDGGDIVLNVRDLLLMRRGSQISTTAGTAQQGGDGGNITINLPEGFIVGVKRENSDITANAFTGSGGRVNITAQGIFGLQFRPQLTEFSDITASSTFGISGVVTLNLPNIDPGRGLVTLPITLIDPTQQIDRRCVSRGGRVNSFVATGRGGLPSSPTEPLTADSVLAEWIKIAQGETFSESPLPTSSITSSDLPSSVPIVEAQGWVVDRTGAVQLIAIVPIVTPEASSLPLLNCIE